MDQEDRRVGARCPACTARFDVMVVSPHTLAAGMRSIEHDLRCPSCGGLVTIWQWDRALFPPRVVRMVGGAKCVPE